MHRDYSTSQDFHNSLGRFYQVWIAAEFSIDLAIGKFLKISDEQAQQLTATMEFGRKVVFLKALISKSGHKRKDTLNKALNAILNDSKRNIFAHSFLMSTPTSIHFVERSPHGGFTVKVHDFTPATFEQHVSDFVQHAKDFEIALGYSRDVFEAFGQAALNFKSKS